MYFINKDGKESWASHAQSRILRLYLATGWNYLKIAHCLCVKRETINVQMVHIRKALGVENNGELIVNYYRNLLGDRIPFEQKEVFEFIKTVSLDDSFKSKQGLNLKILRTKKSLK